MATANPDIGHIVDEYAITNENFGGGGFGNVYKASHIDWGVVAVKRIFKNLQIIERDRKMLEDEARTMTNIRSSYVVQLLGVVMNPSNYALVLEYMCHGSLRDYQKNNDVSWPIILDLVHDVILGMNYLHKTLKLVHRDVKIDNILVDKGPKAKVSDFGLSVWHEYSKKVSRHSRVSNTPDIDVVHSAVIISAVTRNQRPDEKEIPVECPLILKSMMEECWNGNPYKRPTFQALKEMMEKSEDSVTGLNFDRIDINKTKLIDAAAKGDIKEVKRLLSEGYDVTFRIRMEIQHCTMQHGIDMGKWLIYL
ncbi:receptor-interacting serine/threonine-protein kinase 2-like [Saccoglossus kowalevskii]|uniref:Receptor-interacting serine/threonine-protein kinase 2-like n=1 Tax=Saccoglossus kowalevskii TaxID=10224 RepID=A0ABM0MT05_SACKO|nr:PREDICTED: receptor-interacting serine/threonine-protein kinase 2-like [Saccoglossus kowalevskii]